VNYGKEELLDNNIINPIPILSSSLLDHRSTLGNQGILLPSFHLASPSLHPPTLALISMDAIVTSFHIPYSYWPPSGVTTNENHYNFHVNGS
jgi:hypothetical protein